MWNYLIIIFTGLIFQNQEQSISKHVDLIAEMLYKKHTHIGSMFIWFSYSVKMYILRSLCWHETKSLLDNKNIYFVCSPSMYLLLNPSIQSNIYQRLTEDALALWNLFPLPAHWMNETVSLLIQGWSHPSEDISRPQTPDTRGNTESSYSTSSKLYSCPALNKASVWLIHLSVELYCSVFWKPVLTVMHFIWQQPRLSFLTSNYMSNVLKSKELN